MTGIKQINANRKNAKKSTGPKTPEGKATVAFNAMKHGILSRQVLLPDEDESTLVKFGKNVRQQLQPFGEMETFLAERIITAAWRLRRLPISRLKVRFLHGSSNKIVGYGLGRNPFFVEARPGK